MNFNEVLGYTAAICTTLAFLPQALKTWRTKSARDLSLPMFVLFTFGVLLWLLYGLFLQNMPIVVANAVTLVLASSILYHKLKYG